MKKLLNSKGIISALLVFVMCISMISFNPIEAEAYGETFIIDPGHGGSDPGACAYGRAEAADVLRLSFRVGELISPVASVTYTRTTDVFISLQGRCDIANGNGNQYFCSIHRNAGGGTGVETYHMTGSGATSVNMAYEVNNRLASAAPWRNRGVKNAYFTVITNTNMPAILAEVGFIDTEFDNQMFDEHFEDIAYAIAGGLLAMIGQTPGEPINKQLEGRDPVDIGGNFYAHVRQSATGLYLTDREYNACVSEGVFDASQTWHFVRQDNGSYSIGIDGSGHYLDIAGGVYEDGTNIQMYPGNGSNAQKFFIYYIDGNYYFKALKNDKTVDVDSASGNVQLYGSSTGISDRESNPIQFNARSFEIFKLCIDGSAWNAYIGSNVTAYIRNVASGLLLSAEGDNAIFKEPTFTDDQKWIITRNEYGGHEIKSVATGKVLDVSGASIDHGADINLWDANGSKAQRFFFIDTSSSRVYIKPAYTNTVVDMDAGNREIHACNYGTSEANILAQVFEIVTENHLAEDLSIRYPSFLGNNFTANIVSNFTGGAFTDGGNTVSLSNFEGKEEQVWTFQFDPAWNAYKITGKSGKAVDVVAGGFNNGDKLQLWDSNDTAAQRFRFYAVDGGYYISPANSQRVVDIALEDNSILQLYGSMEADNRKFGITILSYEGAKPVDLGDTFVSSIQNKASGLYVTGKAEGVLSCTDKSSDWTFIKQANGSYVIKNEAFGKVLDVENGNVFAANVQLWEANGSLAQSFFIYESNGAYVLRSAKGASVLDMDATSKELHVYPQTSDPAAAPAQTFIFAGAPSTELEVLTLKSDSSYNKVETYVTNVKTETTAKSIIAQFENENAVVFDIDGNQVANEAICGTGYSINLVVNGNVIDALTMVIAGDVDGNGVIDSTDYMRVKSMFLGAYNLAGEYFVAGDVDNSGTIDTTDYLRLKSAFMGTYNF
jgi:hypothetical protein